MRWKAIAAATVSMTALMAQAPARAETSGTGTEVSQVVVTAPRTTDLEQVVGVDKTGTPIKNQPRSVQVVPEVLLHEQGGIHLVDALRDVSGATQGGQFAFGFFDRVIVRGLNVTYLNDGLPDGTSDLTGIVHSLTGVERVEVLKGPGSAMYGDSEEGGTINLVHYKPSDLLGAGISEQYGSFNTSTTDAYLTGPTGLAHVDYRIDAEYQTSDGFRGQASKNEEVHTAFSYRPEHHDVELRLEYQHLEATPDAIGIPFSPPKGTGLPLDVSVNDRYYTPYAEADQDIRRIFLSDAWTVSDFLTVNLRGAYTDRDVDLTRNAGGSVAANASGGYALTRRQLREQHDHIGDLNLQAEPTWRFSTGPLEHVLITGGEVRSINGTTWRETADLPNVADIYAPVVADPALSSLVFKCDSGHSCDDADLRARFFGLYAIDQIDVTQKLKVRLSVRQDWFDTHGVARSLLPVNPGQEQPCSPPSANACPWVPGQPVRRYDAPASYDVGAVYFLTPELSLFGGYSDAFYPIFNTEEPETIGQEPERGIQTEVGVRGQKGGWLTASTSFYQASRDNVFTLLTEPNPSGSGNIDVAQNFSYQVQGWETDVNLRPTRSWNVLFNTAVQDGKITRYPQTPADIGHAPPSVPSFLANFFTTYDWSLPGDAGTLQGSFGLRYRDHEYADAGLTRLLPGEPLLDLGLSWMSGRYTVSAGVQNLLDQRNFLYGDGTGGGALPGAGRTGWVRLAARL